VRTPTCPLQTRREKFRRIVRVSVQLAILLLLLWLLQDALSFHAALAEIQRSVTEQTQQINGLNHQMAGLTVKINGVVQQMNQQPVSTPTAAMSQPSVDINPNWAAAGLLGILARFMPALAAI
jgi:uncharacterized coiled-coil protein SlyX